MELNIMLIILNSKHILHFRQNFLRGDAKTRWCANLKFVNRTAANKFSSLTIRQAKYVMMTNVVVLGLLNQLYATWKIGAFELPENWGRICD